MNKTQKIIIVLLITAIVFSILSIAMNVSLIAYDPSAYTYISPSVVEGNVSTSGQIGLIVEGGGSG